MHLPGTVFRTVLLLFAAVSASASLSPLDSPRGPLDTPLGPLDSLRSSALQTQWQKALFKNVSDRAAQLSDAAVPALLWRLDSSEFRAQLTKCCPSVSGLTAAQLLERLQEQTQVSEVTSGFPAVMDVEDIFPDLPVMSIADGLRGSFFQNSWQGVLLDAKDPDWVFHRMFASYAKVSCQDGTVKLDMWGVSGCEGVPMTSNTYPLGQCIRDEEEGGVFKFTANSTVVIQSTWLDSQEARLRLDSGITTNVSCPTGPPYQVLSYIPDNRCHNYTVFNASSMWRMEDGAEMNSYGLKPFASTGAPKSLQEASERGPYALVNHFLYDQGSLLYGEISAVFSFQAMRDTALLSAIDTGYYQSACTEGRSFGWKASNCSAYLPFRELGTMRHFNHLFLINDDFWTGSSVLAQHFARLEGDWGSHVVAGKDLINYWEANAAATLWFPHDIRFLIGSFSLFGSASGASLQRWAKQRGWVLMWSLGPNSGKRDMGSTLFHLITSNQTFALNQRLLDPEVALNTTAAGNLSLDESVLKTFRNRWTKVEVLRKWRRGNVSNSTWAKVWHRLMRALPPKLHMRPLKAGSCLRPRDAPECVGVNGNGDCICYSRAKAAAAEATGELFV